MLCEPGTVPVPPSIDKETATAQALETKIDELAGDISTDEADLQAATEIREKEAADFAVEEKELTTVIDMLQRAIAVLEKELGGASLMQVKSATSLADALARAKLVKFGDYDEDEYFGESEAEDCGMDSDYLDDEDRDEYYAHLADECFERRNAESF